MNSTFTLIRKELRQHWLPFLALGLIVALGSIGVLAAGYFRGFAGSVFQGVGDLLAVALPFVAAVICGRLVVAEYRAKTQLFLEGLPVSRLHMVLVKYLFGLLVMLVFVALLLVAAGWIRRGGEAMTPLFAAILFTRAGAGAFFWHSFFFTAGLLGRYRWPILILLGFVVFFVDQASSWDIKDFGPFVLLDDQFGSEREHLPVGPLKTTLLTGGVITLVAMGLALVREGNVSAMLAAKMSHREKVTVAVVILGAMAALGIFDDQRAKPPYSLEGAEQVSVPGVLVKVAGPPEAAKPFAEYLAGELSEFGKYLGIEMLPAVFVTQREDIDADQFDRGQLAKAEGFVVRANYTAGNFSRDRFLAWLIPELIDFRTHGRAALESRRWMLDGLGEFWIRRARLSEPLAADRDLALRALYAAPGGVTEETLNAWIQTRERVGEPVAAGLAWSGLKSLALAAGPDACRRFLESQFAAMPPYDFRATWRDWRNPWPERLPGATSLDFTEFLSAWNATLVEARATLGDEFATVPRLRLTLRQKSITASTTILTVRLTANPTPDGVAEYRIRYLKSRGLDVPFEESELIDETGQTEFGGGVIRELPASFSRGTRVIIGASMFSPALGCDITSGWQRLEIGS